MGVSKQLRLRKEERDMFDGLTKRMMVCLEKEIGSVEHSQEYGYDVQKHASANLALLNWVLKVRALAQPVPGRPLRNKRRDKTSRV